MSVDTFSKENRWYFKSLEGRIKPDARKLLEEYSKIPSEDVDSHIYKLRDVLWNSAPYPSVGEFKFLNLSLPAHPRYLDILSSLSSQASYNLLDLGCCVAQELRFLAFAGVPSTQLFGSDLHNEFLTLSYDLFNDRDYFKGTLAQADVFNEDIFEGPWKGWDNSFRIVHAGLFLHLFATPQQITVCRKIVKLLQDEKGAIFLGEMVGCEGGSKKDAHDGTSQWRMDLHDAETFKKMWNDVAKETGTTGMWKIEANFKKRPQTPGEEPKGFFSGEGVGWITFSVERL